MYSSNQDRNRKDNIIKANKILIQLDSRDISGSVTFHFKKGEGIVQSEVRECERWNGTTNENKSIAFNA